VKYIHNPELRGGEEVGKESGALQSRRNTQEKVKKEKVRKRKNRYGKKLKSTRRRITDFYRFYYFASNAKLQEGERASSVHTKMPQSQTVV